MGVATPESSSRRRRVSRRPPTLSSPFARRSELENPGPLPAVDPLGERLRGEKGGSACRRNAFQRRHHWYTGLSLEPLSEAVSQLSAWMILPSACLRPPQPQGPYNKAPTCLLVAPSEEDVPTVAVYYSVTLPSQSPFFRRVLVLGLPLSFIFSLCSCSECLLLGFPVAMTILSFGRSCYAWGGPMPYKLRAILNRSVTIQPDGDVIAESRQCARSPEAFLEKSPMALFQTRSNSLAASVAKRSVIYRFSSGH